VTDALDLDAYLARVGYSGDLAPTRETLDGLHLAHATHVPFENLDILLGRPIRLDLEGLQAKLVRARRGGYCFEQNMLFRGGLRALGFDVTSLQARVVRGLSVDAPRPMLHMVLQVNLPEGPFLADVGFGNLAPTAPLLLSPDLEQDTPHEVMRFIRMGDELTLQSKLGDRWEHIYRVVLLPRVDAEYEICNWFTASHPDSPYRANLIAARPGPGKTRTTLFNARLNVRHANGEVERRTLSDAAEYRDVLAGTFGLKLTDDELARALKTVAEKGAHGAPHPFFA
jgi:N-hydroxyarylamine O-acetyltransferase